MTHGSASDALKLRDGLMAVAEWEAEHGAFTPEELDVARRRVEAGGASRDGNCARTAGYTLSDLG